VTDLNIRPARADDQDMLRAMVKQAGLDPTDLNWPNFLIAENGGTVVGIGQVRPKTPELGSLIVVPKRRGKGIGGALVEALAATVDGPIYLECRSTLVHYYSRFGFEEILPREAPMPLRLKATIGSRLAGLFGMRLAVMVRSKDATGGNPTKLTEYEA